MTSKMDRGTLTVMLAAICAVLGAYSVPAQEGGAAAGGGDGAAAAPDGATAANRDVEPFTPQRGPAALWRRANLKTLIANPPNKATGWPPATVNVVPSPVRPGMGAAPQRNAIGAAMPPRQGTASGVTAPAGNKPAGVGIPTASVPVLHQMPDPAASHLLRGAAINGTTMGRAASGSGSIGGAAKDHSGINGTTMPPKR
jgi:hypothetical protein